MRGRGDDATSQLLDALVHVSRTLGSDPRLVLHGGGNTSVKTTTADLTGAPQELLWIKGSGHDLAGIGPEGFAPLRLARLRALLPPTEITDLELANELRCASVDAGAPDPSVETLVHALVPHTCVLHSHADAILALTHSPDGRALVERLYGDRVVVVPYAQPGQALAAACQEAWQEQAHDGTEGIVVLDHGIFAFGDDPAQALERHTALLALADAHLAAAPALPEVPTPPAPAVDPVAVARLRSELCAVAGRPMVLTRSADEHVRRFLATPELVDATRHGLLTPDHVLWTKRLPLVGDDLAGYAAAYREYVDEHAARSGITVTPLDPAPRVVLDPALGMITAGRTAAEARATQAIYRHTMDTIAAATRLGGYRELSAEHVFDLEYWSLQQAKLHRSRPAGPLAGTVAVVTGAASGIGRAAAAALLDAGTSVVGWDLSPDVATTFDGPAWLGLQVDVTDPDAVRGALAAGVDAFGGLDILVVAAGIFPGAAHLDELEPSAWRRTMAVNVDSVAYLYGAAHPLLALAPRGGRVVVIASKNVPAPGPGAAAYSSSKAALTQLSRVAALEWAGDGIRVNMLHPDAVFDTGLWTPELLAARAEHYGMSVEEYKRRNMLHAEVTSADVGRLVVAMADDTFRCTTGAQVPIDGGNERVI
ncbi:bifunctional aldolase/short-chain dehydrogenase [Isoptericola sp. b441]|uniref:Bifunctional aldolase/short-chain dehydrogenase n=1 Tax=Actinotalea lenta TaxID=3064654 RepID=A0ABT9DBJ0_9CELL|nr:MULTISPECIES: bifunctional aldolase/short-chain dehydrogenase [unclassified Isoptericola]MDO8106317.1 bifunctional aldolase/short-chain dehydrogenase [Isoptericola sp. b441]MDO8121963.1 bifunctional aldolase/short-chain dehydrogenase [Isoptericola sp. b490]